jgi:hypothetical protein
MANGPRSLRALLAGPDIVVAPGCFDAFSAVVAREAGFNAVYMSGGLSATSLCGMGESVGDIKPVIGHQPLSPRDGADNRAGPTRARTARSPCSGHVLVPHRRIRRQAETLGVGQGPSVG